METLAVHGIGWVLFGWQVARLAEPGSFLYEEPFTSIHFALLGSMVVAYALYFAARVAIRRERARAREETRQEVVRLRAERDAIAAERSELIECVAAQAAWAGNRHRLTLLPAGPARVSR
jgi:hypothetical protein